MNESVFTQKARRKSPYYRPLIQTMRMLNKNNQVKFSERFSFDYMGASEFERGSMAKRLLELNEQCEVGSVMIDGCDILVCYSPLYFSSRDEVELYLSDIYWERLHAHEPSRFNQKYRKETAVLRKAFKEERNALKQPPERTDSWFDIENGLFWTTEKCNIKDIRLNLRKSVEFIMAERARSA